MSKLLKVVAAITINLFLFFNVSASELPSIEAGVAVGSKAPAFSLPNAQSELISLEQIKGEKGVVLIFFRSADWCPYCKKYLIEINEWSEKVNALGYKIVAISYDNPEVLAIFANENKIQFELLSDKDSKTIKAYDVLHKDYQLGSKHYGLPYPGVMVIDNQSTIREKYFYEGYKKRLPGEGLYHWLMQSGKAEAKR